MKIRTGFVSNSSSSSFVMVIDEEAHKRALAAVQDVDGFLAKVFEYPTRKKFMGKDVIVITGGDYEGYNVKGQWSDDDIEIINEKYEGNWEYYEEILQPVWTEYVNNLPKSCYIEERTDR